MSNPESYYPSDLRSLEEQIKQQEDTLADLKAETKDRKSELAKLCARRRAMILDGMPLFDGKAYRTDGGEPSDGGR